MLLVSSECQSTGIHMLPVPSECQSTGDTHVATACNLDLPSKLLNSQSSAMPTVTDDNSEPLSRSLIFQKIYLVNKNVLLLHSGINVIHG